MSQYSGSGPIPEESTLYKATIQSYETQPMNLDSFQLIVNTPTLKAWFRKEDNAKNTILVAPRGTILKDWDDMSANWRIAFNQLKNSDRQKRDANTIRQLMSKQPPYLNDQFLASHSLGGAISLALKQDYPFLQNAVLYNSAFQPSDLFRQHPDVKFQYTDSDFLYKLGGRSLQPNNTVIPAGYNINVAPIDSISGHVLSNFSRLQGGSRNCNEQMSLEQQPPEEQTRQKLQRPAPGIVAAEQSNPTIYALAAARALEGNADCAPIKSTVYGNTGAPLHGSGFWSDFGEGFMSVVKPVASIAKPILGLIPHPAAQAASAGLSLAGLGRSGGIRRLPNYLTREEKQRIRDLEMEQDLIADAQGGFGFGEEFSPEDIEKLYAIDDEIESILQKPSLKETTFDKSRVAEVKKEFAKRGLPDTTDTGPLGSVLEMAGIAKPPKQSGQGRSGGSKYKAEVEGIQSRAKKFSDNETYQSFLRKFQEEAIQMLSENAQENDRKNILAQFKSEVDDLLESIMEGPVVIKNPSGSMALGTKGSGAQKRLLESQFKKFDRRVKDSGSHFKLVDLYRVAHDAMKMYSKDRDMKDRIVQEFINDARIISERSGYSS